MTKKLAAVLAGIFLMAVAAPMYAADAPAAAPKAAPKAAPAAAPAAAPVVPEPPVAKVGDQVPEFKLKNAITGESTDWGKDVKGKAKHTVVVFMNTGCSSCLAELMTVRDTTREMKDVAIYAIAVDKRGEEVVKAYYQSYKIDVNYLVDTNFDVPPQFGFNYTPAMIIADKSGKIIFSKGGFRPKDRDKLAAELVAILK